MKTTRIFIASSSELVEDRKAFRAFLGVENDRLHKKGVYLELIQWEHFLDAISDTRLQDEYNAELVKCDIVVCLFYSKAGMYTLEEFNTAYQQFKETGKPLIYTYFKSGAPAPDPQNEQQQALVQLKQRLSDIGHFYTQYDHIDSLKYQFRKQLDRLEDKGMITLQEEMRFISGEKAFNEHLTRSLIEYIEPYCPPAKRFLDKVGKIANWESQKRISDKAKEIIAYSFVGVIGIQLSKLMAIGKEDLSETKQRKYIQKSLDIAKRTLDLANFALISTFWDVQKQSALPLSPKQIEIIRHRFEAVFEPDIVEQFQLLQTLLTVFEEHNIQMSFECTLDPFREQIKEGSSLQRICKAFLELNKHLDKVQFTLQDCFEAETLLASFLKHFAFLVQYNMASIKSVGYNEVRNTAPRYLHSYAALGIDSKANVDAEKVIYTEDTVHTDAVLLFKGSDYQKNINLFPFVIDINALTYEYGVKICFYRAREVSDDSFDYLFLEDNSKVNLVIKDIAEQMDFNELMLDNEKRSMLNLDNVCKGLQQASQEILNEINLDDI